MTSKEEFLEYLKQRKSCPKTNYYLESLKEAEKIKKESAGRRPKLLLHACCAVCASFPIEFLTDIFDVTIYYNNSNIWPKAEYDRRLSELKRYIEESGSRIGLIVTDYDNENYMKKLEPYRDDPEGFRRCFLCYTLRMDEAYQYAEEHGFDYFTTVMSISRQKDSQKMNEIGRSLSRKYPSVRYFYSDFKKGGGQVRQHELVEQYCLYRQDYCGCEYSWLERQAAKNSQKAQQENS